MKLSLPSIEPDTSIPPAYALCVPAEPGPVSMGINLNPAVTWSDVPPGTRSLALLVCDPDAPSVADDVNKPGRSVPYNLPRADFFHWVLVDIPPTLTEIAEGADSEGVTPRGKPLGPTPHGVRGYNDYTSWFTGDPDMEGVYGGYDGPCPPWNDERIHRYRFTLYALDVESLGLSGSFGGREAGAALDGHVLAEAEWTGTYAVNPDAR
jgi:Raf kinase inhibitor-like YbhB/YbcL family protein